MHDLCAKAHVRVRSRSREMMKKILNICMLLMAACCFAQQHAPQDTESAEAVCVKWPWYPYYYCDCYTSPEFGFPLMNTISDTTWYTATVNDLKQGMSAYWFADCSVTFEIYAFCTSDAPSVAMTVGPNQMREMDVAKINQKLDEMGSMAELASQVLKPRVRVYPNGGTGTVYCYPYDQGPHSTCDNPLPVIPRMTYVCDRADEVYELQPEKIASNGIGFIRWKQKNNLAATVWLTDSSCTGEEIGRAVLTDSMHVMMLDAAKMRAAKQGGRSVFVHVSHPEGYVGRMYYHNRVVWSEQRIDTTFCQGRTFVLPDTVLRETTVYSDDTAWTNGDTLSLTAYHLTVVPPTPQYDTLSLKASQLPMTYLNRQYIPKNGWGDYDFTIHQANRCDERYMVHVEHAITTQEVEINDTLCMGKTVTYGDVTFATDTVIRDSLWTDADTWTIRDITIHFTEPELEYDTIWVSEEDFGTNGYWYGKLGIAVQSYGTMIVEKKKKNECTRWIELTVNERVTTDNEEVQSAEKVRKILRNGTIYIRREKQLYDLLGRPVRNE